MKTEELVALLARETPPADRGRFGRRVGVAIAAGALLALVALHATLGVRADIGTAVWIVAAKAGFCALIAVAAVMAADRLAKPGAKPRQALAPILVIGAGVIVALAATLAAPEGARWFALTAGRFPSCLVVIPLLSIPIALALAWAWREAAPTNLTLAGAGVGACAGAVAAIVFSLHCPVDSVAYVGMWYGAAIGIAAALGAVFGGRLLRW